MVCSFPAFLFIISTWAEAQPESRQDDFWETRVLTIEKVYKKWYRQIIPSRYFYMIYIYMKCVAVLPIQEGEEARNVVHLQYTMWPDHGVPESAEHLFSLLKAMHAYRELGMIEGKATHHTMYMW